MAQLRAVLLAVVLAVVAACSTAPSTPAPTTSVSVPPSAEASSATNAPPPPAANGTTGGTADGTTDGTTDAADAPPPAGDPPGTPATSPVLKAGASCPTGWGSLPESDLAMGTGEVDGIRAGRHACFDRLVIDIDGPPAGFSAKYVDTVVADGSGKPLTVPGGARIQFVVHHPKLSGPAPGGSVANVAGFSTFRSVVAAGSFEGYTTFGVGVRARLPFRVLVLPGGHGRIVLDVAHRW